MIVLRHGGCDVAGHVYVCVCMGVCVCMIVRMLNTVNTERWVHSPVDNSDVTRSLRHTAAVR